ncbi:hypothetical protein XA68_10236 [Ophiocordyceps unilateralis]|uniref:Uncharacterized protein n=1 Tax=Ophiocordyceps unilateralis TaxID=268505 RepID=A0A2A9NZR1_OPHUN|nr:hypothetical protein XA68_10236 [Ophiocordyceps unilateralis]
MLEQCVYFSSPPGPISSGLQSYATKRQIRGREKQKMTERKTSLSLGFRPSGQTEKKMRGSLRIGSKTEIWGRQTRTKGRVATIVSVRGRRCSLGDVAVENRHRRGCLGSLVGRCVFYLFRTRCLSVS